MSIRLHTDGDATATDEARVYSKSIEFDPSEAQTIRVGLSNTDLNNTNESRYSVVLTDTPDSSVDRDFNVDGDLARVSIDAEGDLQTVAANDSTDGDAVTSQKNSTQDIQFAENGAYMEVSLDGSSTVTGEVGSQFGNVASQSVSGNYPSGESLHLRIAVTDMDSDVARPGTIDIEDITIT